MRLHKFTALRTGRGAVFDWSYDRAEIVADGVVHAVGVALGLIGAIAIVVVAAMSARPVEIASVLAYGASLLAMLALSAAYNMWPVGGAKWLLRRFDHAAIFLLIAGTFTPFLTMIDGGVLPTALLAAIWIAAITGVVLKIFLPRRLDGLSIVLYLLLGWSVLLVYRPMVESLPVLSLCLLAAGGALYTVGVIFHVWDRLRFQNAIWHAFVLIAAACHYGAVLDFVASRMR